MSWPRRLLLLTCPALLSLACATPSSVEAEPAPVEPGPSEPSPAKTPSSMTAELHAPLARFIAEILPERERIPAERRATLDELAAWIVAQHQADRAAKLVFICTHNSRRSHMAQLWAQAAAAYHGVGRVETYSGGTEATAFNPRAVAAMRRAGFEIEAASDEDNPRYAVSFSAAGPRMQAFSKTWDDPSNPGEGFAAVMTCSQADAACPFVRGASSRISLPYEDPKAADGSPEEAAAYDARARQIAVEMLYLFEAAAALDSSGRR